jgi:hypothetical protein
MKTSLITVPAMSGRPVMRAIRLGLIAAALTCAFSFLLSGSSQAKGKDPTETISGSYSGSTATTGFDFDNDNPSDQSGDLSAAGTQQGAGQFNMRRVTEIEPVPGSGCGAFPAKGCNIDGVTDGCLFTSVGSFGAFRFNSSGDILIFQQTGGTTCINPNTASGVTPPFDFTATLNWSFNGGSGKFAGVTGSAVDTESGQVTVLDHAGHSFGWNAGTYTGTLTQP